jgi:hypothetical protein
MKRRVTFEWVMHLLPRIGNAEKIFGWVQLDEGAIAQNLTAVEILSISLTLALPFLIS